MTPADIQRITGREPLSTASRRTGATLCSGWWLAPAAAIGAAIWAAILYAI